MGVAKIFLQIALVVAVAHGQYRKKRVVGGAPYSPGDYPFSVSLWYLGENNYYTANTTDRHHTCGGSLIEADWVLTSAVCFDDEFLPGVGNLSQWFVVIGMYSQATAEADAELRDVAEVFVLPEYSLFESHGDIALLKLDRPANLSDPMVDTIDINENNQCPEDYQKCTVIGWGQTAESPFGDGSYVPRAAEVEVQPIANCAVTYSQPDVQDMLGPIVIDEGNVCAGVPEGGKDACNGDSGGPLLCQCGSSGEYQVAATVTTGYGCARPGYPGVYANVGFYSAWIKQTIADNSY